jgi:molybdenum cofactor cytidylyltransferase
MGQPKMSLPWGKTTVIGQVISTLVQSGLEEILVVTGGGRLEVENALKALPKEWPVRTIFNPEYQSGEMISSIKIGLVNLNDKAEAALIALGDQPQVGVAVVKTLLRAYYETRAGFVIPSYQMRRGHPIIIGRSLWQDVLSLTAKQTLRDLLEMNRSRIHYVVVDTDSILQDLDTPADYYAYQAKESNET